MSTLKTLRILTDGGMVSPGELKQLVTAAQAAGCSSLQVGSRQEIYLQVEEMRQAELIKELKHTSLYSNPGSEQQYQNIVTSFPAADIFPATSWMLSDTYFEALERFDFKPRLKINIVDPLQGLIPLFSGNLNFVASPHNHFWYLYIHLPEMSEKVLWPALIDGDYLASLSRLIEDTYYQQGWADIDSLFLRVSEVFKGKSRKMDKEPAFPATAFPNYEGLNKSGNSYWLGIYRRNYEFPLAFIKKLCTLCAKTKIGKISLTTWKSILIKDIREFEKPTWEILLGKSGINIRHSSLELHWQTPDLNEEGMKLKSAWVRELDEMDIRTTGLSFAVQTGPMDVVTSVVIERNRPLGALGKDILSTYSIFHSPDFRSLSHRSQLVTYITNLSRKEVAGKLRDLCKKFYNHLEARMESGFVETATNGAVKPKEMAVSSNVLHQCSQCLTVYDQQYGDPDAGVEAATPFEQVPLTYCCSLCEAPKSAFNALPFGISVGQIVP